MLLVMTTPELKKRKTKSEEWHAYAKWRAAE